MHPSRGTAPREEGNRDGWPDPTGALGAGGALVGRGRAARRAGPDPGPGAAPPGHPPCGRRLLGRPGGVRTRRGAVAAARPRAAAAGWVARRAPAGPRDADAGRGDPCAEPVRRPGGSGPRRSARFPPQQGARPAAFRLPPLSGRAAGEARSGPAAPRRPARPAPAGRRGRPAARRARRPRPLGAHPSRRPRRSRPRARRPGRGRRSLERARTPRDRSSRSRGLAGDPCLPDDG